MCMVDFSDGYWVAFTQAERTARRVHRCYECSREIELGERHEEYSGLHDDGARTWYRYRTCAHCVAARGWLLRECGGWLFGGVLEDLEEHWADPWARTLELGRLIILSRGRWRDRTGNLLPVPVLADRPALV